MKKVLILGGSGFVGTHLLNHLVRSGYGARVLSRNPTAAQPPRVHPDCEFRACSLTDSGAVAARLEGCTALVNLVGILNERGFGGGGFRRAHVDGVAAAIEACEQAGVRRFVHMSALNAGQGESHYLKTKGEAEALLEASSLDWTLFQPSVIFGPGDSFINRFAQLLKLIPVWLPLACPESRFQPVFVGDVAAAFVRALDDPATIGRRYPLVGPRRYTLRELVTYTRDTLGLKRWIVGLPDGLSRLQALAMDLVPGKPFSSDNYRSLQLPSVADRDGLAELGLPATPLEAVVPSCLGRGTRAARYQAYRRRAGR